MNILYLASEARPFIASGGLADVAGSLPQELCRRGHDCRVVLPLYADIPQSIRQQMRFVRTFNVPLAWRNQYCGAFKAEHQGVTYYFIDNEYYFKRAGLYGYYDDAERFAFFSKAAVEMIQYLDFEPDILHCNDWQTAMAPVYLNIFYRKMRVYRAIKSVFTIHNIQYQGHYGMDLAWDVLGIPECYHSVLEYNGDLNMMKAAIQESNLVNTVSPTYAQEIRLPGVSHGLDSAIRNKGERVIGILNGIDTDSYDPSGDAMLFERYGADSLKHKEKNKKKLCDLMGIEYQEGRMLLGIVSRLVSHKGFDLVRGAFDSLMKREVSVVVLGSGEREYEQFFEEMQARYPGRVGVKIGFVPDLARKIYGGADVFLMPSESEPCGLAQMVAAHYGTPPIVRQIGGLRDTIFEGEKSGEGNGFTFYDYNYTELLAAVDRAHAVYHNKKAWEKLQKRAMACDFSWKKSAEEYENAYQLVQND